MNNTANKTYTGPYKVVKVFNRSQRYEVIRRGLTREAAKALVNSYPDSNTSMVVFYEQYWGVKWYV